MPERRKRQTEVRRLRVVPRYTNTHYENICMRLLCLIPVYFCIFKDAFNISASGNTIISE
jgi:hypothetical protein